METNPLIIILNNGTYNILIDDSKLVPLRQGYIINSKHMGFVVAHSIEEAKLMGYYQTERKIVGVGLEKGFLKVFEEGKRNPWVLRGGILVEPASTDKSFEEHAIDETFIATENFSMFGDTPKSQNPIDIVIEKDFLKSYVILDPNTAESRLYRLYPSAFLGGEHYGFRIIKDSPKGRIERRYLTQKRIDALGIENDQEFIRIYEDTKWSPWRFNKKGDQVSEAAYEVRSRKDIETVRQYLDQNVERTLHIKRK